MRAGAPSEAHLQTMQRQPLASSGWGQYDWTGIHCGRRWRRDWNESQVPTQEAGAGTLIRRESRKWAGPRHQGWAEVTDQRRARDHSATGAEGDEASGCSPGFWLRKLGEGGTVLPFPATQTQEEGWV